MKRVAYQIDELGGEWEWVPCRPTERAALAYWKRLDRQHDTPPAEYEVVERYPLEHGDLVEFKVLDDSGRPFHSWLLLCPEDQIEVAQAEAEATWR